MTREEAATAAAQALSEIVMEAASSHGPYYSQKAMDKAKQALATALLVLTAPTVVVEPPRPSVGNRWLCAGCDMTYDFVPGKVHHCPGRLP